MRDPGPASAGCGTTRRRFFLPPRGALLLLLLLAAMPEDDDDGDAYEGEVGFDPLLSALAPLETSRRSDEEVATKLSPAFSTNASGEEVAEENSGAKPNGAEASKEDWRGCTARQ
jgi:hypothetical protein